jgi:hypothetical protein
MGAESVQGGTAAPATVRECQRPASNLGRSLAQVDILRQRLRDRTALALMLHGAYRENFRDRRVGAPYARKARVRSPKILGQPVLV